ncbi:MAG: EF-hand domain-containing protein [Methyloceanibacter sp.]
MPERVEDGFAERRHLGRRQGRAYIVNFQMVDTDKDGKITAAEFKTGCGKGWVQNADASTTKDMIPPAKL